MTIESIPAAPSPDSGSSRPLLRADGLCLGYGDRQVVKSLDLEIPQGQFLVVLGPSGSGKSTLLMALNGSIPARSGRLEVMRQNPSNLHGGELERFRERIGFIFQSFHLVGRLPVLHNVASGMLSRIHLPQSIIQMYTRDQYRRILEALRVVGLEDRVMDRCDRLSGGQKQRVAIARALVQQPLILLADEPISSLDPRSARGVMEVLRKAAREFGITVVCNLHHIEAAREFADRVVGLNDGRLVYDGTPDGLTPEVVERIYQGDRDPDDSPEDSSPYAFHSSPLAAA
jgi:phosphonate transport system ATP-binding protein